MLNNIFLSLTFIVSIVGCDKCSRSQTQETEMSESQTAAPQDTVEIWQREDVKAAIPLNELTKIDIAAGSGAEAASGNLVSVHYTGWLTDGTKFDSSRDRNAPFDFPLGQRRVISGWDEGVKGMKIGGKRILVIPSSMGYGERGAGHIIPPNSVLIFEVELMAIK